MYSIAQYQPGYWTVIIRFPYAHPMLSMATAVSRERLGVLQDQGGR
jgi:hypothetical protein